MNQVRVFLLFAWLMVGFLIWEAWQRDYATPLRPTQRPGQVELDAPIPDDGALPVIAEDGAVPAIQPDPETAPIVPEAASQTASTEPVIINTDVLRLRVDPRGASVVGAELLEYRTESKRGAPPVRLFDDTSRAFFVAQSGWVSAAGDAPSHQAVFSGPDREMTLEDDQDSLMVPFVWLGRDGISIERVLHLQRGSYAIRVEDRIVNQGTRNWRATPYYQLLREPPIFQGNAFTNPEAYSFVGAAWYSAIEKFNKIAFADFDPRAPLNVDAQQGWVAMLQHYFFAAWVPSRDETLKLSTGAVQSRQLIRAVAPAVDVAAGSSHQRHASLFVGPKLQEQMAALAPGLELAIDFGVLTFISEPLHWLLSKFHALTGNWGWAIILLVLLIKALFFKLSEAQYRSFAKMRQVQPRIEALKERYGDDRQKFNVAMMELYKKEKINPMGGCLPILLQLPVFFALYWVLLESVELRHAPFIGWIQNLTAPDPYFVLPALNLGVMWLTQKLQPAPGMDPLQRKMMQWMPVVFGVLFAFFPAGLVLYWTVNGALGLLQQWIITRRFAVHSPKV